MQTTTDPDSSGIVFAMIAEDNGKDHTTQIAGGASDARNDAYPVQVNGENS